MLHKLQVRTLPNETPPIGLINQSIMYFEIYQYIYTIICHCMILQYCCYFWTNNALIHIFCKCMNFVYGLSQILFRHCNMVFFVRHNQIAPFILGFRGATQMCWPLAGILNVLWARAGALTVIAPPMLCFALSYSANAKSMHLSLIVTWLDPVEHQPKKKHSKWNLLEDEEEIKKNPSIVLVAANSFNQNVDSLKENNEEEIDYRNFLQLEEEAKREREEKYKE